MPETAGGRKSRNSAAASRLYGQPLALLPVSALVYIPMELNFVVERRLTPALFISEPNAALGAQWPL